MTFYINGLCKLSSLSLCDGIFLVYRVYRQWIEKPRSETSFVVIMSLHVVRINGRLKNIFLPFTAKLDRTNGTKSGLDHFIENISSWRTKWSSNRCKLLWQSDVSKDEYKNVRYMEEIWDYNFYLSLTVYPCLILLNQVLISIIFQNSINSKIYIRKLISYRSREVHWKI